VHQGPVVSALWPIAAVPSIGCNSSSIAIQTEKRPDSGSPWAGEAVSPIVVGRACCVVPENNRSDTKLPRSVSFDPDRPGGRRYPILEARDQEKPIPRPHLSAICDGPPRRTHAFMCTEGRGSASRVGHSCTMSLWDQHPRWERCASGRRTVSRGAGVDDSNKRRQWGSTKRGERFIRGDGERRQGLPSCGLGPDGRPCQKWTRTWAGTQILEKKRH